MESSENKVQKQLVANLLKIMRDRNITQAALAEYMGVTEKTVRSHLKEHGGYWVEGGETGVKA